MARTLGVLFTLACASFAFSGDITVGGSRPAKVFVPSTYDPGVPMPLILLLHGYGGDGARDESWFGFRPFMESEGFLYCHPDAMPDACESRAWNATDACCWNVCGGASVDDAAYLQGVIEEVQTLLNVDPWRIYIAGWSAGGFMAYRMACQHSDTVAAVASFAGATFNDSGLCQPSSAVHVLQVHGTSDQSVPYGGGSISGRPFPGAIASVQRWAIYNGCSLAAQAGDSIDLLPGIPGFETDVTRYVSECNPNGSAELWTIRGGDHFSWLDTPNFTLSIIRYFLAHPKRPLPQALFDITPESGPAPFELTLSAAASTAPEGSSIGAYQWDFGDGTTGEGVETRHTYSQPGRYVIRLTIRTSGENLVARTQRNVTVLCPAGDLSPWAQVDIGAPPFPGGVDNTGECFSICGAGNNISARSDQFHFVFEELRGDFVLTAQVSGFVCDRVGAQVGLMLRESLDPEAPYGAMLMYRAETFQYRFRYRLIAGQQPRFELGMDAEFPTWIRIERAGNDVIGYYTPDGMTWVESHRETFPGLPELVLVGLAAVDTDVRPQETPFRPLEAHVCHMEVQLPLFRRGDGNTDGLLDIADAIFVISYLFTVGPSPTCMDSADASDNGSIDLADPISILSHLFANAGPLPPPFGACGVDSAADVLDCQQYSPCN